MWIKFSILILVALINVVLGLVILLRNRNKDKFIRYFFLICLSGSLWSIGVALSLIITNAFCFLWIVKVSFILSCLIFIFFLLFAIEFPYKIKKTSRLIKYCLYLATLFIFYIIIFDKLVIATYFDNFGLHYMEDKFLNLVFALYFVLLLI